jgi:hypothetical protein
MQIECQYYDNAIKNDHCAFEGMCKDDCYIAYRYRALANDEYIKELEKQIEDYEELIVDVENKFEELGIELDY